MKRCFVVLGSEYGATRARSNENQRGGGVENGGGTSTHAIASIYTQTRIPNASLTRRNAICLGQVVSCHRNHPVKLCTNFPSVFNV